MVTSSSEHGGNGREVRTSAGARETERLVSEAKRIFALQAEQRWKVARSTAAERIDKLDKLRAAIERNREALYTALAADLGRHRAEAELLEVSPILLELEHARRHLKGWMRPRKVATPMLLLGTRSELRYEPRGRVLILAPWNYPASLVLVPVIAAVAAGNCVIVRPSEKAASTGEVLATILREAFDEREVACLTEPGMTLASALLELPFDHIFFTGSPKIGRLVMAAAAKHLASVTLELGGKSPLIVDETTDIAEAGRRGMWGKFINAGQTCIAPDYALVPASRMREFVDAARAAITSMYGATPDEQRASKSYCRIIDAGGHRRIARLLADSVARGAKVEAGGEVDEPTRYIAPTLLTNVDWDSPIMSEEIFGPVLPVLSYEKLDDALGEVRRHGKPLALYVFSRSRDTVEHVLATTTSGGVAVNNTMLHYANPELPFGGVGESGAGSYHGEFGFKAFSHERSVLAQKLGNSTAMFHPPYTEKKERLLRFVGRLLT
jgi:aldehyde dehydrogenase (NAD+)